MLAKVCFVMATLSGAIAIFLTLSGEMPDFLILLYEQPSTRPLYFKISKWMPNPSTQFAYFQFMAVISTLAWLSVGIYATISDTKKHNLQIVRITAGVVVALSLYFALCFVMPGVYSRLFPRQVMTPQEMRARDTMMRFHFLSAAASEAHRVQGAWPASVQQLVARPDSAGFMAIFLRGGTNDSWGNPIFFEPFDVKRGYGRIISYGADGLPGGLGSGRDLILHYGDNMKTEVK